MQLTDLPQFQQRMLATLRAAYQFSNGGTTVDIQGVLPTGLSTVPTIRSDCHFFKFLGLLRYDEQTFRFHRTVEDPAWLEDAK